MAETDFDRVMRWVATHHRIQYGAERGAKTWLSGQLGVSKQAITEFAKQGRFPHGYLHKISSLTSVPVSNLTGNMAPEVRELAKRWNMQVRDVELILIRAGLDVVHE